MEKLEQNYNMIDWWKKVYLNNYANFSGRARRKEYWFSYLLTLLLIVPLYIILVLAIVSENQVFMIIMGGIFVILFLAIIIPTLAVTVRRLHDTNKSGWYYLISFIPFVGPLILFVFTLLEGDRGENNYGSDPKEVDNQDEINQIGIDN